AEDGTFGFGMTSNAGPVTRIINDHFRPHLEGENCMATEKLFDVMARLTTPYGGQGLASYAISAVDLALWDLKGKLLQRPVYELLGGPQKERIFCYATGFDVEWYLELGFRAVKLPMTFSPVDGLGGLRKAEDLVAATREKIGDDIELMLDCWMALDVEYTVRLAEILKPYRLKWIEDYLLPEDIDGFAAVRQRLPWQGLATGEHWYLPHAFSQAANRRLVDIFQPDVLWVGGISPCVHICHIAEVAGISVITHGGMNAPYGQHLAFAMPAIPWGERSGGVAPRGVPLEEVVSLPGTAVIKDGHLIPNDAPGFGIEVDMAWVERVTVAD
ncbi:MAG: L-rhamnonate dehydratase, partial [Candidatus Poribacteria bacterium]|nr:L-rhamnonate dehydratase [Candidatus Poribacteria bacterium]